MVETKAKATKVRERFPNNQALEGKENGGDHGKGYSRQRKVSLALCVYRQLMELCVCGSGTGFFSA
jgi:hypothetical protein